MPPVAVAIAAVSAVATVGFTYQGMRAQKKASERAALQQENQTRQAQRSAIREMQIKRSQALASAQGLGISSESSGVGGGIGSLSSQFGSDTGYASMQSGISKQIGLLQTRAASAQAWAGMSGQVFSAVGGFGAFKKQEAVV